MNDSRVKAALLLKLYIGGCVGVTCWYESLFAETIAQGIKPESVKSDYQKRFGITARQFNSVCRNLKGKVESIRSNQKRLIKEAEQRIKKAEKTIKHLEKQGDSTNRRHQEKRRLAKLRARHKRIADDQKAGRVRICFGYACACLTRLWTPMVVINTKALSSSYVTASTTS